MFKNYLVVPKLKARFIFTRQMSSPLIETGASIVLGFYTSYNK